MTELVIGRKVRAASRLRFRLSKRLCPSSLPSISLHLFFANPLGGLSGHQEERSLRIASGHAPANAFRRRCLNEALFKA